MRRTHPVIFRQSSSTNSTTVVQALTPGLLASKENLLVRSVKGSNSNAITPCHVQRQRAPAAAGLDHRFARPQPELAADMVHLRHLGLLERHRRLGEISARVEQLLVEP